MSGQGIDGARAAYARGDYAAACAILAGLTQAQAEDFAVWLLYGNALSQLGELARAREVYGRALELRPHDFSALYQMGCTLQELREYAAAVPYLERATGLEPGHALARCVLGVCCAEAGQREQGLVHLCAAAEVAPDNHRILARLAFFYEDTGEAGAALEWLRRAMVYAPENPQYQAGIARLLIKMGRLDEAREGLQAALAQRPEEPALLVSMGLLCAAAGQEEALEWYGRVLEREPGADDVWGLRGLALEGLGRPAQALECFVNAIRLAPQNSAHHHNYAGVLLKTGRARLAVEEARRAVELAPQNRAAFDNLLFYLHYLHGVPRADVLGLHRQWAEHYYPAQAGAAAARSGGRAGGELQRPLRLGFVSGDLRAHAVAFFLLPLLRHLDPAEFAVYCYSNAVQHDGVSAQIIGCCAGWREIAQMDDGQVCALVAGDEIDVLIDLSGHTAGNRLGVFARRAAACQISWLGYPDTTGLAAMDWRIVDECAEPEAEGGAYSTEGLLRMPGGFHCYVPPEGCPEPVAAPGLATGEITFGSFNNFAKVSDECVALWAEVVKRVPGSRLLLKSRGLEEAETAGFVRARFAACGVDGSRVLLKGETSGVLEHLRAYHAVDIALDTFPYNGTTTTCEALWLGVPVVSLVGDRHCARMGASLLAAADLADYACRAPEEFVRVAAALAGDAQRLRELRAGLRARLRRPGGLLDAPDFARRFAEILRKALAAGKS